MAYVDGYGVADCVSIPTAKGILLHGSRAIVACGGEAYGLASLEYGVKGLSETLAECLGKLINLVRIASVVPITATKIRLTFDRGMLDDAALDSRLNYGITPITAGAAPVVVNTIEPEPSVIRPTYVDMLTSEMTNGATYRCAVSASGPTDPDGVGVDPGANTEDFSGLGDFPAVLRVESISANRVDVSFTENMKDNADIRNPAKYNFDGGLLTLNVLDIQESKVQLVTSDQSPGVLYTLTVTP